MLCTDLVESVTTYPESYPVDTRREHRDLEEADRRRNRTGLRGGFQTWGWCQSAFGSGLLGRRCLRVTDEIMTMKSPTEKLPAPKNYVYSLEQLAPGSTLDYVAACSCTKGFRDHIGGSFLAHK
jgi:hypothetical protein